MSQNEKAALDRLTLERDCYRAVLESAGYELLDVMPSKGVEFCRRIGATARERTLEKIASPSATSPTIFYMPCAKHQGVAYTLTLPLATPAKQVCPICHPPEGAAK